MAVKNIWHDEEIFGIELAGERWSLTYAFPVKDLAEGASLSRMMNNHVKETLNSFGTMIPKEELKMVAKQGVDSLRAVIEPYFESRGIGE